MGLAYEVASTPGAYLKKAFYNPVRSGRSREPRTIAFGSHRLQHCVLWEPDEPTHDETVMYFHGGGYLVGTPESMVDAANVYNSQGYRFCSVGFRLMPFFRFPAQADDAFAGIEAALGWLSAHGLPGERLVVGGSSCGGHLACLVGYGRELARAHGLDASRVAAVVSVAGIVDADDMLLHPFPSAGIWRRYVGLPAADGSMAARHEALLPYSPIALIDTDSHVPFFAIHGTSDEMSPFRREAEFAMRLNRLAGPGTATLRAVDDPAFQHMVATVTLHKGRVQDSAPLTDLFGWLEAKLG
ncbi:MAG: alpha/beta hydrolase [Atopobiaceae bacterium]|jgi:acetyl esterase/lipase|nr:alpha/beta hydrolase [Atopobiaceae bacterium]MCH4119385.1 alpha/beta hydrolase [Atopobiaceae bacterium]MCI1318090.1 alpha/beta hydrolase [Atopobiaceae bacterium]MCI1388972.1 alpha/beta hydrolase [Atopobiaceae bacterium]MCI1431794.1 alpha/beta hydrolase [Atopobiaceae bacterium]